MKKNIFCIIIMLSFLFSACKKEMSCTGFPEADLPEFSYALPCTLVFENSLSEQFIVTVSEIILSEPYSFECRDLYNICPCLFSVEARATDSKNTIPYSFLIMEQSDVSEVQMFKYNVRGFIFEFDFINELPYIDQMEHLVYHSAITLGNHPFTDVIEIRNIDLAAVDIARVFFNKKEGVLGYDVKSKGERWSLVK